jgi:hypothetical protein
MSREWQLKRDRRFRKKLAATIKAKTKKVSKITNA